MIEFVTQYPLFIGGILLIVMLSGIFLGFFFRRHAAEQSAKEILATPQFEQAAEAERQKGYRDQKFAQTTAKCIERDSEVQGSILRFLANSLPFYAILDDRFAHKIKRHEDESRTDLDLRFERFKSEMVGEVNKNLSASSTAIFKRFDDLADRIDRRIDEIVGKP